VGGNFRLDAIQAAILRVKLTRLEDWHEQRKANAAAYGAGFRELEERHLIGLPEEAPGRRHVFNQYVIRVARRDALQAYLAARRIGSAIYYPVPLHLQQCFEKSGQVYPSLPRSEQAATDVLALPVFPGLTVPQRDKVIRCVSEFLFQ
jgi:dTDP-4-amino-4,6-dideoxygalactose transaminase